MMRSIFRRKKGVESYFAKLSSNFLLVDTSLDKEEPSCWSRKVAGLIVSKKKRPFRKVHFPIPAKKKKGKKMKYKGNLDTVRNLQKSLIYIYKILSMIRYRNTRTYNFVILQC